jgi:hypothetical protein
MILLQVSSIYSNSFALEGGSSRMDQLPYYVVVSKLEAQNSALLSEQHKFRDQLCEQSRTLDDMSTKLQVGTRSSRLLDSAVSDHHIL